MTKAKTIPTKKKIQLNSLTFTEGKTQPSMKRNQSCCHFAMATDDNSDNPSHEENSIEFPNIHGRKNPAIHEEKSRLLSFCHGNR